MHGRLKVRTSAEEALRKKKEHEQKAAAFRSGMSRVLAKKEAGELDDEVMALTGKILGSNPDIATLWNLRRLCILKLFDEDKENQKLFDNDLSFTELCLRVNPKSYCAWHHRCWILENAPSPNWQNEVDLCTRYLKLDERNFHCWDYRRYVTEKANIPAEKELEFCTEKIQNNFSNYSSWHYRSKLLPVLYPNRDDPSRPISEDKLREELELVLTAAFTDPGDSSAWFYQRWLLGYSQPELDIAAFRIDVERKLAVITFTRPVNLKHKAVKLSFNFNDRINQASHWIPVTTSENYSVTWILQDAIEELPHRESYSAAFVDECGNTHSLVGEKLGDSSLFGIKKPKFGYEFGQAVVDVLKTQLESCQQLLEYEPDSKWTLLTAALLMKAIDPESYHDRILEHLEKLQTVDPMRTGYYRDLTAKWSIEMRLKQWIDAGKPQQKLDLSNLKLNRVTYEQYLAVAEEIDLSSNQLEEACMHKFQHFVFCQRLALRDNCAITAEARCLVRQHCPSLNEVEVTA